jgi:hypothetical protein
MTDSKPNTAQLEPQGENPRGALWRPAKTQRAKILSLLTDARGDWVSLLSVKECGAQYNARIHELRRLGFSIENKICEIDGRRLSWFRLKSMPKRVDDRDRGNKSAIQEGSLFGNLAPERYPD